jgi:hypothetical protein
VDRWILQKLSASQTTSNQGLYTRIKNSAVFKTRILQTEAQNVASLNALDPDLDKNVFTPTFIVVNTLSKPTRNNNISTEKCLEFIRS